MEGVNKNKSWWEKIKNKSKTYFSTLVPSNKKPDPILSLNTESPDSDFTLEPFPNIGEKRNQGIFSRLTKNFSKGTPAINTEEENYVADFSKISKRQKNDFFPLSEFSNENSLDPFDKTDFGHFKDKIKDKKENQNTNFGGLNFKKMADNIFSPKGKEVKKKYFGKIINRDLKKDQLKSIDEEVPVISNDLESKCSFSTERNEDKKEEPHDKQLKEGKGKYDLNFGESDLNLEEPIEINKNKKEPIKSPNAFQTQNKIEKKLMDSVKDLFGSVPNFITTYSNNDVLLSLRNNNPTSILADTINPSTLRTNSPGNACYDILEQEDGLTPGSKRLLEHIIDENQLLKHEVKLLKSTIFSENTRSEAFNLPRQDLKSNVDDEENVNTQIKPASKIDKEKIHKILDSIETSTSSESESEPEKTLSPRSKRVIDRHLRKEKLLKAPIKLKNSEKSKSEKENLNHKDLKEKNRNSKVSKKSENSRNSGNSGNGEDFVPSSENSSSNSGSSRELSADEVSSDEKDDKSVEQENNKNLPLFGKNEEKDDEKEKLKNMFNFPGDRSLKKTQTEENDKSKETNYFNFNPNQNFSEDQKPPLEKSTFLETREPIKIEKSPSKTPPFKFNFDSKSPFEGNSDNKIELNSKNTKNEFFPSLSVINTDNTDKKDKNNVDNGTKSEPKTDSFGIWPQIDANQNKTPFKNEGLFSKPNQKVENSPMKISKAEKQPFKINFKDTLNDEEGNKNNVVGGITSAQNSLEGTNPFAADLFSGGKKSKIEDTLTGKDKSKSKNSFSEEQSSDRRSPDKTFSDFFKKGNIKAESQENPFGGKKEEKSIFGVNSTKTKEENPFFGIWGKSGSKTGSGDDKEGGNNAKDQNPFTSTSEAIKKQAENPFNSGIKAMSDSNEGVFVEKGGRRPFGSFNFIKSAPNFGAKRSSSTGENNFYGQANRRKPRPNPKFFQSDPFGSGNNVFKPNDSFLNSNKNKDLGPAKQSNTNPFASATRAMPNANPKAFGNQPDSDANTSFKVGFNFNPQKVMDGLQNNPGRRIVRGRRRLGRR